MPSCAPKLQELLEIEQRDLESFLGQPLLERPASPTHLERHAPDCAPTARHPETIGPYRVLRHLGEGGMGSVYLAEQNDTVHRQVAIKVLKRGIDSREVVRRFEFERRALAILNHPHIASILDTGTTAGGRPNFVLEFVDGPLLNDHCNHQRLSIEERLELFIPVCNAVEHAHRRAILHRDLKPANVMVKMVDGAPVPKVIDFGIAKALGGEELQQTLLAQVGRVIGTPAYMSPE
jgi:serine/threonine protein kinase